MAIETSQTSGGARTLPALGRQAVAAFEPWLMMAIGIAGAWLMLRELSTGHPRVIALLGIYAAGLLALAMLMLFAQWRGTDASLSAIALISGVAVGPLSAIGMGLVGLVARLRTQPTSLVHEWYERISRSTDIAADVQLAENVGAGRTLDLGGELPPSFPATMVAGTLDERQLVLGHIARHFHPGYLETLTRALKSPEPAVRVQAAAVAAHVGPLARRMCSARVDEARRGSKSVESSLRAIDELVALRDSGLLDETEKTGANAVLQRLSDEVVLALRGGQQLSRGDATLAERAALVQRSENLLLERREFAALRGLRSAARVSRRHPTARFRKLRMRAPLVGASA